MDSSSFVCFGVTNRKEDSIALLHEGAQVQEIGGGTVNILCCMGPKMLIMTDLVSLLTVPHLHGSPFQSCGSTGGQQEAGKLMVSV